MKALDAAVKFDSEVVRISEAVAKAMAKAGKLKLPPLLEERRLRYGIPNGAFARHAQYDRVLLFQIEEWCTGTYGDGGAIVMPDDWAAVKKAENPRGVIVSAGLHALDVLRTNGMELGHIVTFVRMAPFRTPIDTVAGHHFYLIVQNVGDIIDSEDTQEAISTGRVRVEWDEDKAQHYFYDVKAKKRWDPQSPWRGGDY
jgi:hypothetical protein